MKKTAKTKKAAKKPEKSPLGVPVTSVIKIHMIFNGENTTGWVHTHGMNIYGLPELEIRNVHPIFMMVEAGKTLNHIAQYMVDSLTGRGGAKQVSVGQNMGLGHGVFVHFEKSKPLNPNDQDEVAGHFQDERWEVTDVPGAFKCAGCESEGHQHD